MTTRTKILIDIDSYIAHTKKTEASYALIQDIVKHRKSHEVAFVLIEILRDIIRPENYVFSNTIYADYSHYAENFCKHLADVIKGDLYNGDDYDFGEFDDPLTES